MAVFCKFKPHFYSFPPISAHFQHFQQFALKVSSMSGGHAYPLRVVGRPRGGFRDTFRALWRWGREVCSPASRRGVPPRASAWARGRRGCEVCSLVSRQGIPSRESEWSLGGRVAKFSSVQVGVYEGAKRGEICSPAMCEALFGSAARSAAGDVRSSIRRALAGEGARRRARARRRTICSPARCSACRRWRRRGGLRVHNTASWRLACGSINFGRPGALLGSSVAFGSGCGQALPEVPLTAPLC